MNIGDAATRTGLPVKTIRYYEDIGLIAAERGANGYRLFDRKAVRKLHFLQRARALGFTLEETRTLLSLYEDEHRSSADVKAIVETKIAMIDRKLAELQSLRAALTHLADACDGDQRPDCPIIDELAGEHG
ncbi:MAG: Cu(I)-responsive transcriptional regulator [Alphaproteobacteria bacterium]|nr:Cu(I)-responsive transcriptional regulator [Alphaproteobacteria bacterium]MCB9930823.1 Cu(I)-responsive transcriptional regulator [Alphaproteobacteria bacterium]